MVHCVYRTLVRIFIECMFRWLCYFVIKCVGVQFSVWPGGVMVRPFDLRLRKLRVRLTAVSLSDNNLGQVVRAHVPLRGSVTK